jgi:hypothetical protein
MKIRWKILLASGMLLALLAASLTMTLRVQPESELAAYKKSLREQGEKLELSQVLPPPVAPESNSVDAVEDAFRAFGSANEKIPDVMKMVAPGKALIGWRQPEARGADFTNAWEDYTAELAASRPAIELLQEVLERPALDFQLDYKQGAALLLPHLAPMKRAAQKLEAAAVCDLHNGDPGAAATNILILLALVQKDEPEGILISHLVRIAMTAIAVAPTWELLQATNVSDASLAAVQSAWQRMNFWADTENAFVFERAWMGAEIQKSRASHQGFQDTVGLYASMSGSGGSLSGAGSWPPDWDSLTEKPRYAVAEVMWRSSWSYAEERRMLQTQQIILETVRGMRTNQNQFYKADYDAMESRLSSLGLTNPGAAFFRKLNIPDFSEIFGDRNLSSTVSKTIRIEAARRVVVAALALKRFQLQHGKLPATLDELTPQFLASVPVDPYDGRPLRYRLNADGTWLLYSVGEDGVDDGGDATSTASGAASLAWQNAKARDWVWPQPATAAEIKYFYEHPPK